MPLEKELEETFRELCRVLGGNLKRVKTLAGTLISCFLSEPRMIHVEARKDKMTIFVEPPIFYGKWSAGYSFSLPKATSIGAMFVGKGSEISANVEASILVLHEDGSVSIEGTIPSSEEYFKWLKELEEKID